MIVFTILLTALKILLKILLVLLLVILALLLIILLVPIRYESHGKACMQSINIQAKVTWLLRLLRIQLAIKDDHIAARVMVLTFTLFKKNIEWQYPLAKMNKEKEKTQTESSLVNAPDSSPEGESQNVSASDSAQAGERGQADEVKAESTVMQASGSTAGPNVIQTTETNSESTENGPVTGSAEIVHSDSTEANSSNQRHLAQSSATSDADRTLTIDPSHKPTITRPENPSVKKHSRKPKWQRMEEKRKKMTERAAKKKEKAEVAAQRKAEAEVRKAEKAAAAEQKKAEAEIKKAEKEARKAEKQAKSEAKKAEKEAKLKGTDNTNLNAPENAEAQVVNSQISATEVLPSENQTSSSSAVNDGPQAEPAGDNPKKKKKPLFAKKPKQPELIEDEEEDVGIFPDEELKEEEDDQEEKEPILDKIKKGWDIFQQKSTKKTISRVKKCIFGIIGHILPNKVKIRGLIGMEDPSLTGQILGVFYMFYPKYSKYGDYKLVGDFEKFNLNIKYMFDGYIRIGTILFKVLSLLIDRNIRKLIIFFIKKKK